MTALDFQAIEPLLGYDARQVLQEAAHTVRQSLGLEAGGRKAKIRAVTMEGSA